MKVRNCVLKLVPGLAMQVIVSVPLASMLVAQVPVPAPQVPGPVAQGPVAPAPVGGDPALSAPVGAYEMEGEGGAFATGMADREAMPSQEQLGGAKQFQMTSLYAMEIRRVEAATTLDAAQKTKLTIGAKGLAKKKSQEFVKGMVGRGPVPAARPADDAPEIKFVEVKSFADIDARTKAMLDDPTSPHAGPFEDPEWLKLVKSVLKPDQYTQYQQVIAANKLKTDKAMVEAGVAKLGEDLALNRDQESRLASLVLEHLSQAKQVPDQISTEKRAMMAAMPQVASSVTLALAQMDTSALQGILTPQQLEQLVDYKLDILRRIAEQENLDDMQTAPLEGKP